MPDFKPIFKRYAADLKAEAERCLRLAKPSDLALHGGGVEPGVLVGDRAVPDLEHVEDADLDRRTAAGHAGPLAVDVAGDDRLVHDVARPRR